MSMTTAVLSHPAMAGVHEAVVAVGTRPPGTGKLTTILGWVSFLVGVALIGAFFAGTGKAGMSALRHGQVDGAMGPVIALIAGVFLTAGSALFGVLGITS